MKRGMGEYQLKMARDARSHILLLLSVHEWIRYKEIVQSSELSTTTISKHVKGFVKEGIVERRVDSSEYPPGVYYRLTELGQKNKEKDHVKNILELYQIQDEYLFPDYMRFYTDFDFENKISEETKEKIGKLLLDAQMIFHEIYEAINPDYYKIMRKTHFKGRHYDLEYYLDNIRLFETLERRYERSGLIRSIDEELTVINKEKTLLQNYSITLEDLENNKFIWMKVNKILKNEPLTQDAYAKYLGLKKKLEKIKNSLNKFYDTYEKNYPNICIVLFSEGLRSLFKRTN